jgi:acyl-CoA thioesterase-1
MAHGVRRIEEAMFATRYQLRFPWMLLLVLGLVACGGEAQDGRGESGDSAGAVAASGSRSGGDEPPLVLFLGDSLTAGYGLAEGQAFPALVGRELADEGVEARVVNAGVSGDTTAGGLARLDWVLSQGPDVVVVGLGGNDGLRGLDLAATEENLREIVRRSRDTGARVILLGMKIPPNYGLDYAGRFEEMYEEIADDLDVALVPFLLEGVAAKPTLNLPDRIHPNARGHQVVAETVYPYVEEELDELE